MVEQELRANLIAVKGQGVTAAKIRHGTKQNLADVRLKPEGWRGTPLRPLTSEATVKVVAALVALRLDGWRIFTSAVNSDKRFSIVIRRPDNTTMTRITGVEWSAFLVTVVVAVYTDSLVQRGIDTARAKAGCMTAGAGSKAQSSIMLSNGIGDGAIDVEGTLVAFSEDPTVPGVYTFTVDTFSTQADLRDVLDDLDSIEVTDPDGSNALYFECVVESVERVEAGYEITVLCDAVERNT